MTVEVPPAAPNELARKLQLLVRSRQAQGRSICPESVTKSLAEAGVELSPAEWLQMLQAPAKDAPEDTLTAIASYFGVHPKYLLSNGEHAQRVEAQLALLAALRRNKVRNFAVRQMNEIGADTIERIRRLLDEPPDAA